MDINKLRNKLILLFMVNKDKKAVIDNESVEDMAIDLMRFDVLEETCFRKMHEEVVFEPMRYVDIAKSERKIVDINLLLESHDEDSITAIDKKDHKALEICSQMAYCERLYFLIPETIDLFDDDRVVMSDLPGMNMIEIISSSYLQSFTEMKYSERFDSCNNIHVLNSIINPNDPHKLMKGALTISVNTDDKSMILGALAHLNTLPSVKKILDIVELLIFNCAIGSKQFKRYLTKYITILLALVKVLGDEGLLKFDLGDKNIEEITNEIFSDEVNITSSESPNVPEFGITGDDLLTINAFGQLNTLQVYNVINDNINDINTSINNSTCAGMNINYAEIGSLSYADSVATYKLDVVLNESNHDIHFKKLMKLMKRASKTHGLDIKHGNVVVDSIFESNKVYAINIKKLTDNISKLIYFCKSFAKKGNNK